MFGNHGLVENILPFNVQNIHIFKGTWVCSVGNDPLHNKLLIILSNWISLHLGVGHVVHNQAYTKHIVFRQVTWYIQPCTFRGVTFPHRAPAFQKVCKQLHASTAHWECFHCTKCVTTTGRLQRSTLWNRSWLTAGMLVFIVTQLNWPSKAVDYTVNLPHLQCVKQVKRLLLNYLISTLHTILEWPHVHVFQFCGRVEAVPRRSKWCIWESVSYCSHPSSNTQ